MKDMARLLEKWQLNVGDVREQMYRAPTPRERERWHGLWLLVQGWSVTQLAEALERDSHTIGDWLSGFRRAGAQGLVFEHTGGQHPMGDREKASLRLQFNPQIRLELPGWSYMVPPSPPTPDCWHSENWMTPWTLPP